MGPKKGKAVMVEASAEAQREEELAPALIGTRVSTAEALDRLKVLVAGRNNEHGASGVKAARFGKLAAGWYPIFVHTLFAGLVPPFSPFLAEVLSFYQIQLLHLHPNSILILAIFAYLCEAYLGVMPSVAFFRSFYALRNTAPGERSGCVSFRIADGMGAVYIPMSWDGDKAVTRVTKKVEDFRQKWVLVDAKERNAFFDEPEAPPLKNSNWSSEKFQHQKIAHLVSRMKLVREAGLTGQMVAEDFVRRRIAPLQAHTKPVWMYSGPADPMRLHLSAHAPDDVASILGTLFIAPEIPVPGTEHLRPLHQLTPKKRLAVLEMMPTFTPEGLEGEEAKGAAAPVVEEDLFGESSAASDAEADAAAGGVNPSLGEASSSKQAAPEEEILEVSSDVDEDFVVAPSRRATEEEDEDGDDSGPEAAAKRCEPRTKAIHDRAARSLESTPLKRKAGAAPEEPSAGASTGLRRSANKVWVDTRAKSSG
jgi:Putative gypsy type transposon